MLREPWRTRLLFLSFAVNLVTVPMAASRLLVRSHLPALPMGAPPPEMIIQHMAAKLSADDGEKLRAAMEPHIEDIQVARLRMETSRREMSRILSQPDFDRDAMRTALTRWQNQWHVWSRAMGDAMVDGFATLSPEGRQKLAERPNRPRQ